MTLHTARKIALRWFGPSAQIERSWGKVGGAPLYKLIVDGLMVIGEDPEEVLRRMAERKAPRA